MIHYWLERKEIKVTTKFIFRSLAEVAAGHLSGSPISSHRVNPGIQIQTLQGILLFWREMHIPF